MDTSVRISRFRQYLIPILIICIALVIAGLLALDATDNTPVTPIEQPESYVLPTQGHILLTTGTGATPRSIPEHEKAPITADDTIHTLADSQATIFWADGSFTRLGTGTTVVIRTLQDDPAHHISQIQFHLQQGRTWSHIMSYLMGGSYFRESIVHENIVATVRGTVYNVDTTNGYIQAVDHEVELMDQSTGKSALISAGNALNYTSFAQYLQNLVDTAWVNANQSADAAYVSEQLESLSSSFSGTSLSKTGALSFLSSAKSSLSEAIHGPSIDTFIQPLAQAVAKEDS